MTKAPENSAAPDTGAPGDLIPVTIKLKRKTYETAKAHVADLDPTTSPLGEQAGKMDLGDYLALCLEIYFED